MKFTFNDIDGETLIIPDNQIKSFEKSHVENSEIIIINVLVKDDWQYKLSGNELTKLKEIIDRCKVATYKQTKIILENLYFNIVSSSNNIEIETGLVPKDVKDKNE